MEPITIALTAFSAVKAGVKAGKEIQSLASDIGKLWDALDTVKEDHTKKKNSPLTKVKGVNEEALETFMALQKAKDMEEQLREIIIYTRGMDAWQELLRLRSDIKRQRKQAAIAQKKAKQEKRERMELILGTLLGLVVGVGMLVGFVYLVRQHA